MHYDITDWKSIYGNDYEKMCHCCSWIQKSVIADFFGSSLVSLFDAKRGDRLSIHTISSPFDHEHWQQKQKLYQQRHRISNRLIFYTSHQLLQRTRMFTDGLVTRESIWWDGFSWVFAILCGPLKRELPESRVWYCDGKIGSRKCLHISFFSPFPEKVIMIYF